MNHAAEETQLENARPIDEKAGFAVALQCAQGAPVTLAGKEKSVIARLRDLIIESRLASDTPVRTQSRASEGKWTERNTTLESLPRLERIYQPIRFFCKRSLLLGGLLGFVLEALYQSHLLYLSYATWSPAVLLWLPAVFVVGMVLDEAIGSPFIRFTLPGVVFLLMQGKLGQMKATLDSLAEAVTPGLACAFALRKRFRAAHDVMPEPVSRYQLLAGLLIFFFLGASAVYVTWTRQWPVAFEADVRADLREAF